jgi:hypothetical protein
MFISHYTIRIVTFDTIRFVSLIIPVYSKLSTNAVPIVGVKSKYEHSFAEHGKFDYTRSAKHAVAAYEECNRMGQRSHSYNFDHWDEIEFSLTSGANPATYPIGTGRKARPGRDADH